MPTFYVIVVGRNRFKNRFHIAFEIVSIPSLTKENAVDRLKARVPDTATVGPVPKRLLFAVLVECDLSTTETTDPPPDVTTRHAGILYSVGRASTIEVS